MKTIDEIRRQLSNGEFEFTRHALKRAVERNISEEMIRQTGRDAQVIEEYPDDKYAPSCLLLGFFLQARPLHSKYPMPILLWLRIITLYEPDEHEWYDYTRRR